MLQIKCQQYRHIGRAVLHNTQTIKPLYIIRCKEYQKDYILEYIKKNFFQNYYCIETRTDDGYPYGSFSKGAMGCYCVVCINNKNNVNNNNNKMIKIIIVIIILTWYK